MNTLHIGVLFILNTVDFYGRNELASRVGNIFTHRNELTKIDGDDNEGKPSVW